MLSNAFLPIKNVTALVYHKGEENSIFFMVFISSAKNVIISIVYLMKKMI